MAPPAGYSYFPMMVFLLSLACGFLWPRGLPIGKLLILPALAVTITINLLKFPRGFFRNPGSLFYSSLHGNLMSYVISGSLIILSGAFLIEKQELWIGMVLVAAMPASLQSVNFVVYPSIDKNSLLTGICGTYFGALLFIPLAGFCFLKYVQMSAWNISLLVLMLIFLPMVLSRLVIQNDWSLAVRKYENIILNFCLFIIYYTIAANGKEFLTHFSSDIAFALIIAFTVSIILGFLIKKTDSYFFHEHDDKVNALIILGTMKNCGLAGGIALAVFSPEVALPALIFSVFTFINALWLTRMAENTLEHSHGQTDHTR
jgi:BASS family bile acid:Na+ symporter